MLTNAVSELVQQFTILQKLVM